MPKHRQFFKASGAKDSHRRGHFEGYRRDPWLGDKATSIGLPARTWTGSVRAERRYLDRQITAEVEIGFELIRATSPVVPRQSDNRCPYTGKLIPPDGGLVQGGEFAVTYDDRGRVVAFHAGHRS